jgi:lysophospholipase-2
MQTLLPTVKHTHTLVFLHGKGSSASEFQSDLLESQDSANRYLSDIFPSLRVVFPEAELRMSMRFREEERSWFDMWSVEYPQERMELQEVGLRTSTVYIKGIIREDVEEVGAENVFLAGISQGCATAIHALFRLDVPIGGFIGLCSWLPRLDDIKKISGEFPKEADRVRELRGILGPISASISDETRTPLSTPVFLSHSKNDEVVPIEIGRELADGLLGLGMQVEWKEYEDGGHWINEPSGFDDIVAFIKRNMLSGSAFGDSREGA